MVHSLALIKFRSVGGVKKGQFMPFATTPIHASPLPLELPLSVSPANQIDRIKRNGIALKNTLHDYQLLCQVWDQSISTLKSRLMQYAAFRAAWFLQLDAHFQSIWSDWQMVSGEDRHPLRVWFLQLFESTTLLNSEINDHIVNQPFGYPGDFKTIEYLYEYYGEFLGESMYEVFLNDYTTSIPIAHSTHLRMQYMTTLLRDHIQQTPHAHIVSVGSGGGRELMALLREESSKPATITCVDFDQLAIETVQQRMNGLSHDQLNGVSLHYQLQDIRQLIRQKIKLDPPPTYIYAAGLCDYLSDAMFKRLTNYLYDLLAPNGQLLLCNVNRYSDYHRVYYEILGNWQLIFRDQDALLKLASGDPNRVISFVNPVDPHNAHDYLCLTKPGYL